MTHKGWCVVKHQTNKNQKWSICNIVIQDDPRTTNFLEAWHRRFSSVVGESHPNIYKFLLHFVFGADTDRALESSSSERRNSQTPMKRDIEKNKSILEVVQKHETRSVLDFLKGIAHNSTHK